MEARADLPSVAYGSKADIPANRAHGVGDDLAPAS
jgi:hypothetical protein